MCSFQHAFLVSWHVSKVWLLFTDFEPSEEVEDAVDYYDDVLRYCHSKKLYYVPINSVEETAEGKFEEFNEIFLDLDGKNEGAQPSRHIRSQDNLVCLRG